MYITSKTASFQHKEDFILCARQDTRDLYNTIVLLIFQLFNRKHMQIDKTQKENEENILSLTFLISFVCMLFARQRQCFSLWRA